MSPEIDYIRHFPTRVQDLNLPPEPEKLWDLNALEPCPEDYTFLDIRYDRIHDDRTLRLSTVRILGRLHFWGINFTSKKTPSKKGITQGLWKMFYHMPDRNRPTTFAELFNFHRDTGPRLMGWEYWDEEVGPISRFHPVRPDSSAPVDPEWVRPHAAPDHLSDSIVHQFMLPVVPTVEPVLPVNFTEPDQRQAEKTQPMTRNKNKRQAERQQGSKSQKKKQQAPKGTRDIDPASPSGPAPGASQKIGERKHVTKPAPRRPRSVDSFRAGSSSHFMSESEGSISETDLILAETIQRLTEAVERTILEHTYYDLQRDPNAPSRVPESFATASSIDDLQKVQIGTFAAHAYLKLDPTNFKFDNSSTTLYPYRGRGPVWNNYSCSIDCVIVLGMLLDVGCTNIDRRSWRYGEITELEKAFIEITNVNWEALDLTTNSKMRDLFSRKLCATVPSIKMGEPAPSWAVWSECTRNFSQFYYKFSEYHQACACNGQETLETDKYANCLLPNIADHSTSEGVWMADLIESCIFTPREAQCIHCGTGNDRSETRIDELPLRLVVSNWVGIRVRIKNHTENVNFRYLDSNGKQRIATYRWLGGIYYKEGHVRVFWNDQERGDNNNENIRMYDDEVNDGVIFGGIPPQHPSDRVPHDWTDIGFLIGIYERIINPSMDMMNAVVATANKCKRMVALGRSILQSHDPWEYIRLPVPGDPSADNIILPPEDHVIPVATNHFREVHIDQLPTPVHFTSRSTTQNVPSTPWVAPADVEMQDLNHILDAWPPESLQGEGNTDRPPIYDNLFDSILNSPSRLIEFPEMWPQGVPGDNGAFNFPSLPRADDADSLPFSQPRTPIMDYVHWPSPENNIFLDEMEWAAHAGAVRRSGRVRRSGSHFNTRSQKAHSGDMTSNQPSTTSYREAPSEKRSKAPVRRARHKINTETPLQRALGKKIRDETNASNPAMKAAKRTTVSDKTKLGAGKQGNRSKEKVRAATSQDIGKKDNKKSLAKGSMIKKSRNDEGKEGEEYTEARSAHGGPPEPRPHWIPSASGERGMRKTAIRNATNWSPNKRARFADELGQGPSKRTKL